MRNAVAGAVLVLLSVLVFLTGIELWVRMAYADGSNFDIEMWRYAKDVKQVSAIPGVGHEHRPNVRGTYMGVELATNALGLRNREIALEKPAGTTRILMLGDSVTLGWGAPFEGTTSRALERRLDGLAGGPRFEVVNTGVGNYNTAMELAWLVHRGHALRPDLVLLNYFINDAEETPTRQESFFERFSWAAVFVAGRFDVLSRTYFGRSDWKSYYRDLYHPDAAGWRQAQAKIAELAAFCRERGVPLVFVSYPELHELAPYPFEDVTRALADVAAANALPFIDLLASVRDADPPSLWVTPTDAHPNARAAERYAGLLARELHALHPALVPAGENAGARDEASAP